MQLIFDIPMLPNHPDKRVRRPPQTRNIETVLTGDRGLLVRHPNGFYGNYRLQARPFLQRWQGHDVCHDPDTSAHTPSVGVVECVKKVVCIAPRKIMLDMMMKML